MLADQAFESIKPGDPRLAHCEYRIIARGADALAAACDEAQRAGVETKIIDVNVEGDARDIGRAHAEIALHAQAGSRPLVLLSGGKLTLSGSGKGRGGRNREYLLALARGLQGAAGIWALAADTDGIDGSDDAAGAWIGPDTLARAGAIGLHAEQCARDNNSGEFFAKLGQAVESGPTRTNVNDFRAILVTPGV
jgi:hydroxypyruvate reductase